MKLIKTGGTRLVILTKNYAIKIPRFYSWKSFLTGLICNISEYEFSKINHKNLCPVRYGNSLGIVLVMHRAELINDENLFAIEMDNLRNLIEGDDYSDLDFDFFEYDGTMKNFGFYNGRFVKIDYSDL